MQEKENKNQLWILISTPNGSGSECVLFMLRLFIYGMLLYFVSKYTLTGYILSLSCIICLQYVRL